MYIPAGGRVHHSLPCLFSESCLKVLTVVQAQIIPCNRLATIFINSLEDLIARGVTQTGEEGEELSGEWCVCFVFEYDLVQLARAANL